MEAERREKTDDTARDAACDLGERVVLGDARLWKDVETTPHTVESAAPVKASERLSRDSERREVLGADDADSAGVVEDAVCVRHGITAVEIDCLANVTN